MYLLIITIITANGIDIQKYEYNTLTECLKNNYFQTEILDLKNVEYTAKCQRTHYQ